jgi:hypothetical protein
MCDDQEFIQYQMKTRIKTECGIKNNLKTYKTSHVNKIILNTRHWRLSTMLRKRLTIIHICYQIANTKIINHYVVSGIWLPFKLYVNDPLLTGISSIKHRTMLQSDTFLILMEFENINIPQLVIPSKHALWFVSREPMNNIRYVMWNMDKMTDEYIVML